MSSDEETFFEAVQNSSNFTDSLASNKSVESIGNNNAGGGSSTKFVVAVVLFTVVINATVIYLVLFKLKRLTRVRPVTLLVSHLAAVTIGQAVVYLFNTGDTSQYVDVPGPLCSLVSYLRSVFHSAFFVNIVAIIYERLRSFQENQRKLPIVRPVLIIWSISFVFSIPTVLMKIPRTNTDLDYNQLVNASNVSGKPLGTCKSIPLLGSAEATIAYELVRLIMFNAFVTFYLVYALCQIRSKLKYLFNHSTTSNSRNRMQRKLRSIRLVCFHLIMFAFISLPTGLFVFAQRLVTRVELTSSIKPDGQLFSVAKLLFGTISFVYCMFNPLISLLLIESHIVGRLCCCSAREESTSSVSSNNGSSSVQQEMACQQQLELMARWRAKKKEEKAHRRRYNGNTSRFSTFGLSTATQGLEFSQDCSIIRNHTPEEVCGANLRTVESGTENGENTGRVEVEATESVPVTLQETSL